jgi:hypothetical protein
MNGAALTSEHRRTAYRLAMELHALVKDSPAATQAGLRRVALGHLLYLCGDEALLGPAPTPESEEDK